MITFWIGWIKREGKRGKEEKIKIRKGIFDGKEEGRKNCRIQKDKAVSRSYRVAYALLPNFPGNCIFSFILKMIHIDIDSTSFISRPSVATPKTGSPQTCIPVMVCHNGGWTSGFTGGGGGGGAK